MKRRLVILVLLGCALLWCLLRPVPETAPVPEPPQAREGSYVKVLPTPIAPPTSEALESKPIEDPNLTELERERKRVRAEMRLALSAAYLAQKEFHSEFGRYTTDLRLAGWDYQSKILNFKMGFAQAGPVGEDFQNEEPQDMDTDLLIRETLEKDSRDARSYSGLAEGLSIRDYAYACRDNCTATNETFEIIAVSRIGPEGQPEIWVINDKKELRQIKD